MKKISLTLLFLVLFSQFVSAHCQIPCGIYDDGLRITTLKEDVSTIEKSMKEIIALEKSGKSANQLTRWVINKEEYAVRIQDLVNHYFLAQRIKPDADKYEEKLALLHQIIILSMKAKQTVDLQVVDRLNKAIGDFEKLYMANHH